MDNSIYLTLARQIASFNNLDVVANNTANANTTGYKKDMMVFDKFLTQDVNSNVSFPNDYSTVSDQTSGSLKPTNRVFDFALNGSGYFMVQTPLGIRYTRNGHFLLNNENMLVTAEGYSVLSPDGQPLEFEPDDVSPVIDKAGLIMVDGDNRGEIGVMDFDTPQLLRKAGNGLFISEEDAVISDTTEVMQGALEDSNVSPVLEMKSLIDLQKQVTASSNLLNDLYNMHKNAYRTISKQGV